MISSIAKINIISSFWALLRNITAIYGIVQGTNNFTEFILEQPEYFVDKSLMMKEFLENNSTVISIFRPKLWGKTLNLDMVRKFLEIETDREGLAIPDEEKINRKCFIGTELQLAGDEMKKLEPLKIANVASAMEHQGIYPVIWLDLEYSQYCLYTLMEDYLKDTVLNIFENYPYLRKYCASENEDVLSDFQKDRLRRYYSKNITREDLSESIRFLSEVLFKHFNRKVYVLVNDHNTPFVLRSTFPNSAPEAYQNVTDLLKELFCRAFNDNPYLEKALLADQLPLFEAYSEVFSHLDNFTVYTLLDDQFAKFYGFTQAEVDELIAGIKSTVDGEKIANLYKGYNHGGQVVYNPSSVTHHLIYEGSYDPCWLQTAAIPDNVEKQISKKNWQDILTDLFSGYGVTSAIDLMISFQNCKPTSVYSLLLFSGYLNPISQIHSNRTYQLTVPNDEVKEFYAKKIRDRVKKKLFVDVDVYTNFMEFLPSGSVDGFKEGYQKYISSLNKLLEMKPVEQEFCYNDLTLMLINKLSSRYKTTFRKFPDTNETVAVLIPKVNYVDNAIFIAFKNARYIGNLISDAKIGLKRVKSLKCDIEKVNCTQARNIIEIGIAFCGCNTAVEYDVELLT